MEDRNELKKKILEFLKQGETRFISTTEIHATMNKGFYLIRNLMQDLETEDKVEKINFGGYTFWKLKK
jgi:hypothetical protein